MLAAPTLLEVEPLRASLRDAERFQVAGKTWWLGHLSTRDSTAAAPVLVALTGYDKANVAHALTCALQAARPRAVVFSGVGGGFAPAGIAVGDLVVVEREAYADTGAWSAEDEWLSTEDLGLPLAEVAGRPLWNEFPLDAALARRAHELLQDMAWETDGRAEPAWTPHRGLGITSSVATGTEVAAARLWRRWRPLVESMEGAAAAHICLLYGVPLVELRGISNLVGARDRDSWQLETAAHRAGMAAVAVAVDLLGGDAYA